MRRIKMALLLSFASYLVILVFIIVADTFLNRDFNFVRVIVISALYITLLSVYFGALFFVFKDRINTILKKRDWFMPFAPSVLETRVEKFVVDPSPSPFMVMVFDVPKGIEKDICGVIHVDMATHGEA
ncbi:MAG: carbamoyltransferase C-terminal domain-containing protein [Candidatus Hydrothermarchaeaceae archaeon]